MAALRFSFVGDLHLDSRTPSSRLDDYAQATLSKLQLVLEGCQAHNSTHLFLSGDVFHRRAQSFDYLSKVIAAFRQFKQAGVQVHSIVGNHDIQHDRMDTLSSNPLGLLFEIGLIQRLSEEGLRLPFVFSSDINSRPQVLIRGVDYGKPLPARVAKTDLNLSFVVAHAFYDNALDSHAFSFEEVRASGHDYLLLGHDHAPYPPLLVGQTKVIRPGSLTRGTSHDYQLHRPIQIEHFQVSEPLLVAHTTQPLPVPPAQSIFHPSVFSKTTSSSNLRYVASQRAQELIAQMDGFSISDSSGGIYSFLDGLEASPPVKRNVESALVEQGIVRN